MNLVSLINKAMKVEKEKKYTYNCSKRASSFPDHLEVEYRLDISGCSKISSIPNSYSVVSLIAQNCITLETIDELDVINLDLSNCRALTRWKSSKKAVMGRVILKNCMNLESLPKISKLAELDISGCTTLTSLPDNLKITSWLELADSGITKKQDNVFINQYRWRGIPVDERIVFNPQSITVDEINSETNVEKRRILIERMGYQKFIENSKAKTIHKDNDKGGPRQLIQINIDNNSEPLVCLSVICPSTKRQFMLRVPPNMKNCHQAAAWIAGFDDPELYNPVEET